ncbi:polymorphic toxin-type HINT domain-containing protein [Pendulispora albinea]|uniref:HINT domain-containing protein n=1 Tax=Pendulispora albinea TaxID=2741071 RepID=A0ABZ2MBJ6_9BACT
MMSKSIPAARDANPQDADRADAHRVIQIHRNATYRLFHIEIVGASNGEVVATGRHPFWTQRGWTVAEELTTSDVLMDDEGRSVFIRSIAAESRDAATFNLSVEGTHTFFVVAGNTPVLVHNVDPYDVLFTQDSYGPTFSNGDWAGRSLEDAVAQARLHQRLPAGLTLKVMELNGQWVTLNNRTLGVARMANLPDGAIHDVGPGGWNKVQQLLRPYIIPVPPDSRHGRRPYRSWSSWPHMRAAQG